MGTSTSRRSNTCHLYHVIDERDGLIQVHRPNGIKLYWAVRLPDSPLYGENRARFVVTRVGGNVRESGVL